MDTGLVRHVLRWVPFVLRLSLLLLLLAGALLTCASRVPSARTVEQFRAAVAAGEVDRVSYRAGGVGTLINDSHDVVQMEDPHDLMTLKWSESPLVWHEVPGDITDTRGVAYTVDLLRADVGRAPVRPSLTVDSGRDSGGGIFPDWPFTFLGGEKLWWLATAWVVAFVVMLLGPPPRLANRWAWFWMFTVGQIGAILYFVLEPRPLWRGLGEVPVPEKRVEGGSGCLISIGLSVISVVLAGGIGQLVSVVLG
ncbi:hypothetical protein DQ384_21555 [Sphaerisporangium album]|uniref:Uncharacterized protein n=1 Tax=Sphaerisporangium album TaxID=509200 RepID=A0A367FEZ1_9ACTN|nr:hypothetical protein [Sphaerisporangium album]RCG28953.1 hypothetical protein DQ384_21555 [Sphaerisporangium album]